VKARSWPYTVCPGRFGYYRGSYPQRPAHCQADGTPPEQWQVRELAWDARQDNPESDGPDAACVDPGCMSFLSFEAPGQIPLCVALALLCLLDGRAQGRLACPALLAVSGRLLLEQINLPVQEFDLVRVQGFGVPLNSFLHALSLCAEAGIRARRRLDGNGPAKELQVPGQPAANPADYRSYLTPGLHGAIRSGDQRARNRYPDANPADPVSFRRCRGGVSGAAGQQRVIAPGAWRDHFSSLARREPPDYDAAPAPPTARPVTR